MPSLTIKRVSSTTDCTRGVLLYGEEPICLTLERPWLDNQPMVSCIPDGEYSIAGINSPHFGNVYEIQNVPDRTHILIHKGNTAEDTEGCVILGSSFGYLAGKPAVLGSKAAFDKFMRFMSTRTAKTIRIITV